MFNHRIFLAASVMTFATLSTLHAAAPSTKPATSAAPATTSAPATATAPSTSPRRYTFLDFTEGDNNKTVATTAGAVIAISLPGNATTGYSWSLGKLEGDAVTQQGDIQYQADNTRGLVGSGGTSTATFRATKPGTATITLTYARPWEKDTPPAKTFKVTITVK